MYACVRAHVVANSSDSAIDSPDAEIVPSIFFFGFVLQPTFSTLPPQRRRPHGRFLLLLVQCWITTPQQNTNILNHVVTSVPFLRLEAVPAPLSLLQLVPQRHETSVVVLRPAPVLTGSGLCPTLDMADRCGGRVERVKLSFRVKKLKSSSHVSALYDPSCRRRPVK